MSNNAILFSVDRLKSNEIIFVNDFGKVVGTLTTVNNTLKFIPLNGQSSAFGSGSSTGGSVGVTGANYSDYLYWNSSTNSWAVDGTKVHIGANAGQLNQGNYSIAIGNQAGKENQPSNSIVLNADSTPLNGTQPNSLFINPIRNDTSTPLTPNVLSYNSETKEISYRNLGMYQSPSVSEGLKEYITLTTSILPSVTDTLDLGSTGQRFKNIHAESGHFSTNTLYFTDDNTNKTMSISYDPVNLSSTITNQESTVKAVFTSPSQPNQIDASLLPFNGLTFGGTFNPNTYKQVSESLNDQTFSLLQTLQYSIISQASSPTQTVTTDNMFRFLAGLYYTVNGISTPVDLQVSKLTYLTDLTQYDKTQQGHTIGLPTISETQTLSLKNGDNLFLNIQLRQVETQIFLDVSWSQVEFRVPINGVTTFNIEDAAITTPKLANNSVTNSKLSDLAVTTSKLASQAVTLDKLSSNVQNLLLSSGSGDSVSESAFQSLVNNVQSLSLRLDSAETETQKIAALQTKVEALEEFVNVFLQTYTIQKGQNSYSYSGQKQNF